MVDEDLDFNARITHFFKPQLKTEKYVTIAIPNGAPVTIMSAKLVVRDYDGSILVETEVAIESTRGGEMTVVMSPQMAYEMSHVLEKKLVEGNTETNENSRTVRQLLTEEQGRAIYNDLYGPDGDFSVKTVRVKVVEETAIRIAEDVINSENPENQRIRSASWEEYRSALNPLERCIADQAYHNRLADQIYRKRIDEVAEKIQTLNVPEEGESDGD